MGAMDEMLASMLKNMLPAEVMELMSAENIGNIKDAVNAFVIDIRESLDTIKEQNEAILERLNNGNGNSAGNVSGSIGGSSGRVNLTNGTVNGSGGVGTLNE
jgi:hypothetical protein